MYLVIILAVIAAALGGIVWERERNNPRGDNGHGGHGDHGNGHGGH